MTELPLLVIDVQRGGPSTGLPTKTEQADLLQAMFGRNGEAPVPIVAPAVARRLLRRRPRGRPDRGHLPHPGDAALRRLPRQRLRAVADPRGRRAARHRPGLRHRAATTATGDGEAGVLALPARRRDPGPAVGDPRHRRPRAPHRRAREGRRPRQHLLRPRQPRLHGPHPPGQGRPDRRLAPPARGRRPRRRAPRCWSSVGLDVRPDRRRRTPRAQGRLPGRAGPPAPPQPVPPGPRRHPRAATTRCWSPR